MRRICALGLSLLLCAFVSTASATIKISQELVLTRSGFEKLAEVPDVSLTNAGDLYFRYITADTVQQQGHGGIALVRQSNPTQVESVWASANKGAHLGMPAAGTDGSVAFADADSNGTPLMVTRSGGGVLLTIRGEAFSAWQDPTRGSQNRLFFTGTSASDGSQSLLSYSPGGTIITIVGLQAQAPLGTHHTMVGNGDVIRFRAVSPGNPTPHLAEYDGGVLITIAGTNWDTISDPGGRGDNLVFSFDDGSDATLMSKWGHDIAKPIIQNIKARVMNPTGNSGGMIVYGLGGALGSPAADSLESIYFTNNLGVTPTQIVALGDMIDGQSIVALHYSPDSLNDEGQFAYYAELLDGSEHLFITEALPEPTSAVLLAVGCSALLRRRTR